MGFEHLRTLVIADYAEMRASIRSMLIRFGVKNIDFVVCGEDAIESLKLKSYDLILSDYELGRGKDGQQILEEVRFSGLIQATTTYVLITAVQTADMVMGALEYQPDGYITKPITYDVVHSRLVKILRHRFIFNEINQAIDDKNMTLAIAECDRMVMRQPKFSLQALRIKGKLLLGSEQYDEAESVFRQVVDSHDLAWAQLGLANCMYFKKNYSVAIELLEKLISTNEKYLECYDLLTKIYKEQDQPNKAQKVLELAVEQSPKAGLRQGQLSKIALFNKNIDVAAKAARQAIALNKNSCHYSPSHYLTLAKSLQEVLINGNLREKKLSFKEIDVAIREVKKKFPQDRSVQLEACVTEGLTFFNDGKTEKGRKIIEEALNAYPDQLVDSNIKAFIESTVKSVGLEIDLLMKKKTNHDQEIKTVENQEQSSRLKQKAEIENINNKGIELFQHGKISEALKFFEMAAHQENASISVLLNALQARLVLMQQQIDIDLSEFEICYQYLNRLNLDPADNASRHRKERLQKIYTALNPPKQFNIKYT